MNIYLKPRFFLIFAVIFLSGILFISNVLLKKRVELRVVDSKTSGNVLAAAEEGNSSKEYNLLESPVNNNTQYFPQNEQKNGEIVTVSHTVKEGDTLQSIAEKYHADAQTIVDYPYNNIGDDLKIKTGQTLIIPNGYIEGQPPVRFAIPAGSGQFTWPVNGTVTQYASWFHAGSIDIGIDLRTPVKAADNGKVIAVEYLTTGYGIHIIVDHGGGLTSLYGHLSQIQVSRGQTVSKGQIIGLSGSTGRSTGPHLHFEVRKNGVPLDPMTLLPSKQ